MSAALPSSFDEIASRLALGIEPIDAQRQQRILSPLQITFDDVVIGNKRPTFVVHPSNRFVILYDNYFEPRDRRINLRIFDTAVSKYSTVGDLRRYVPRKLRIKIERLRFAENRPPLARSCQPWLFPGAAYPVSDIMTGGRARVMRHGTRRRPLRPARWVRVIATIPASQTNLDEATVIGRAFGDDRGEFLLLLNGGIGLTPTNTHLSARITVFATRRDPVPSSDDRPDIDPLWDLPLERPTSLSSSDEVLIGNKLPNNYVKVVEHVASLPLGHLLRGNPDFVI